MTLLKARWLLACAVAKRLEGDRLLTVYDRILTDKQKQDFKQVRDNSIKVEEAALTRLRGVFQA